MNTKSCQNLAALVGITLLVAACTTELYDPANSGSNNNLEISQELKDFGFATRGDVKLSINYNMPGFKALVEIYSENPMEENSNVKKQTIQPIYSAYTDGNGKIEETIYIPIALNEAYLYTSRWGLPRCVKLDLTAHGLIYDVTKELNSRPQVQAAITKNPYSYVIGDRPPYQLSGRTDNLFALGRFDIGGYLAYDGSFGNSSDYTAGYITNTTSIKNESIADLAQRSQQYFQKYEGNKLELLKPAEVTNIKVKETGSIDIVYLDENASFLNTFGYYYYEAGSAPKEADFKSMNKYVIIPNIEKPLTVKTGNTIRLKYFGKDGKGSPVDQFPANTIIGWFLVSDGWDRSGGKIKKWSDFERNFFFSNDQDKNMRFVALQDTKTGVVVLGCEDQPERLFDRQKEDYCDLLFFVKTDDGKLDNTGKPDISDEEPENSGGEYLVSGTIAFEDIWPTGGDYDMNDVALEYSRKINFDGNNKVTLLEENFKFIQKEGAATIDNYFAYQVNNMGIVEVLDGCEIEDVSNSIVYAASAKQSIGKSFTIKRRFQGSVSQNEIAKDFNPYIMIGNKGDKRKEVHLPSHTPTKKADQKLIGTENDAYYMNKDGSYPFAIDIPAINFELSEERRSIDKTYPRFATWAAGFGKTNADWYKDSPKKN